MAVVGPPIWQSDVWADTVWASGVWEDESTASTGHINDQLYTYLRAQYIPSVYASADLATLLQYDLSQRTGDYTARFIALINAAS